MMSSHKHTLVLEVIRFMYIDKGLRFKHCCKHCYLQCKPIKMKSYNSVVNPLPGIVQGVVTPICAVVTAKTWVKTVIFAA